MEGLTVGGCKWLGNAVASKVKVKKLPETNPKPISGELPEGTTGSLKINIQLFARKGKEIVGTEFSEIKPTQLVINRERVDFYKSILQSGEKIQPIEVCEVEGKGAFIIEGHHRFVASKELDIPVDIIRTKTGGPTGFPSWKYVEWKKYINEEQFWSE